MYVLMCLGQYNAFLKCSLKELSKQYPKLYMQLQNSGCIIDDSVDEVKLLQERIEKVDNQDDYYSLTINPTMNCNFKCWYCYENHVEHSKMSIDVLERTRKHITSVLSAKHWKKFHLGFFGGEPLLYYKNIVRPLIQHLLQECNTYDIPYSIGFTSNGYLLTESMIEELKSFKISSLQITLDGGKEAHNQVRFPYIGGDSYTKIVENVKKLLHVGISVVLRVNYTASNISTVKTIVHDFKYLSDEEKKFIQVDFHRVWQDSENINAIFDPRLLDECHLAFENAGISISTPVMNQVWASCYADKKNQALINYNGDVYKCTARDFDDKNRLGVLNEHGTIIWDNEKMNKRKTIRFSKEICKSCRIAPICGGTCSQRGLDSGNVNKCIRGLEESGKDNVVLNQFYYGIVKNEISF